MMPSSQNRPKYVLYVMKCFDDSASLSWPNENSAGCQLGALEEFY